MTNVWLIGRFEPGDSGPIAVEIIKLLPGSAVHHFEGPGEALRSSAGFADLIVVIQHRPRQFSAQEIDSLVGAQPLARLVVALADWCASSRRSDSVWPEASTVPLWGLLLRLRREATHLSGTSSAAPLTSSREEALLLEAATPLPNPPSLPFLIESPDRAFADLLRDVIEESGATVLKGLDEKRCFGLLWDADPLDDVRLAALTARRAHASLLWVVALTAMPLPQVVARLKRSGADAVLPKPFEFEELAAALAGTV